MLLQREQYLLPVFLANTIDRADQPAIYLGNKQGFQPTTWGELAQDVWRCTAALYSLGLRLGDHVAHWSENRYEWVIVDLALQALGAVHVPLHATLSGSQAALQITHSESKVLLLSNNELAKRLSSKLNAEETGVKLVSYDRVTSLKTVRLGELMSNAEPVKGRELAEDTIPQIDPAKCASILYSSGTTGDPKGVMLSYDNLATNTHGLIAAFGEQPAETRLVFLPFSHVFARIADLYTWIVRGTEMALVRSRDTIVDDCKLVKPSLINGVPYFFERVHQKLVEKGVADEPGRLNKTLGGELRGCCSGGAALANETFDYYASQAVPLCQGYGLTETSPVITTSTPDSVKRGAVGRAIEDVEIRIADDGEILTRGPHVMLGYWQNEEATREMITADGWLHTGDLGELDEEGFLSIVGRKKEIIVTATGKNVFPTHVEMLLCQDPLILQACVIGTDRKYLSALIVPDPDVLKAEIKARRLWVFSKRGAVSHPQIRALYEQRIRDRLADLAPYEQVKKFTVLDRGFTPENGHLTAKLSLRRNLILQDYADVIEAMYR